MLNSKIKKSSIHNGSIDGVGRRSRISIITGTLQKARRNNIRTSENAIAGRIKGNRPSQWTTKCWPAARLVASCPFSFDAIPAARHQGRLLKCRSRHDDVVRSCRNCLDGQRSGPTAYCCYLQLTRSSPLILFDPSMIPSNHDHLTSRCAAGSTMAKTHTTTTSPI